METAESTGANGERPTRVRYGVIAYAVVLSVITYIHRIAISQAAPSITRDLGLTKVQMGFGFSAFSWGYAIFQVPGGWLADWKGPRRVLTSIVMASSAFTALTGAVGNLTTLVAARFGFGLGQGGVFPVLTKSFTTWLRPDERVRGQGIMWLSARWGGAFTPILLVALMEFVSWRQAFVLIGALGAVWCWSFWRWFRDRPSDHPRTNEAELKLLKASEHTSSGNPSVPWGKAVSSRNVWLLCLQYFCLAYPWYFYITWLPTYIQEGLGQSVTRGAWLNALPLLFGGLGCLACGYLLPPLGRWLGSVARARRWTAAAGFAGAGALWIGAMQFENAVLVMVVMGLASFSNDLAMPPAWAVAMDVGGKYAGSLSGTMNMAGNFAGWVAPPITAYILSVTNNDWAMTFYVGAAIYFVGSVCWLLIDPLTPLEPKEETA